MKIKELVRFYGPEIVVEAAASLDPSLMEDLSVWAGEALDARDEAVSARADFTKIHLSNRAWLRRHWAMLEGTAPANWLRG